MQGPTCTEGANILVHLEAHNGAIVINDVRLSVPGTGNYLFLPVALRGVTDRIQEQPGAILERDPMAGLSKIGQHFGRRRVMGVGNMT